MEILTIVALVTSCTMSIVHGILAYLKWKEPKKDELWDAALKISCNGSYSDTDSFAKAYMELKKFKANGYTLKENETLFSLVRKEIYHPEKRNSSGDDLPND